MEATEGPASAASAGAPKQQEQEQEQQQNNSAGSNVAARASSSASSSSSSSAAAPAPGGAPGAPGAAPADAAPTSAGAQPDQPTKPAGTGVFMPMVGRTYSGRNKPQRRRNATTSCLQPDENIWQQPRRNTSSVALHPIPDQQQVMGADGGCGPQAQGLVMLQSGGFSPPTQTTMMLPANSASGSYAILGVGQQPVLITQQPQQPYQLYQQQPQLYQQQQQQPQVSPFALLSAAGPSSHTASPRLGGVLDGESSLAADSRMLSAAVGSVASLNPSALQFSGSFLQPIQPPSAGMQAAGYSMQSCVCQQDAVLGSSSASAATNDPMQRSCSFSGILDLSAAAHSPSALAGACADAVLSAPHAGGVRAAPGPADPFMSQWASLGLTEQDLLSALTTVPEPASGDTNLEQQQTQIQQHINRLNLMKELLQMRQQHKTQQRLLQLQQTQQEQLLQQQLLQAQAANGGATQSAEPQRLQQDLLQMLQRRSLDGTGLAAPGDAVVGSQMMHSASSLAAAANMNGGGQASSSPLVMAYLQQQQQPQQLQLQLDPQALQGADAATLGSLLQERLNLRQQQQQLPVLTTSLAAVQHQQQPAMMHSGSALAPAQGLVLQGWGQL